MSRVSKASLFTRITIIRLKTISLLSITRILIIKFLCITATNFISIIKLYFYYNCDKLEYTRRDYIILVQIDANKRAIAKIRIYFIDPDIELNI